METLFDLPKNSELWGWTVLILASLGTYLWRGLGVLLSEKLSQDSLLFRWITCVTYAMVSALVIRIIVLPVGILAQTPMIYRVISCSIALAIMVMRKNNLVPAILAGTGLMILFGWAN